MEPTTSTLLSLSILVLFAWATRVMLVLRAAKSKIWSKPVRTMVVLGSGGHTAEMLSLLRGMDRHSFAPLLYVLANSDRTSAARVHEFESNRFAALQQSSVSTGTATTTAGKDSCQIYRVPRSREVGQSYFSSLWTTLFALFHSLFLVFRTRPTLILCNGPGTCIPICAAGWLLMLTGVQRVKVIYVESVARVQTLSLSGRILVHFADEFLVQWPQLAEKYPRAKYIGRLC